MLEQCSPTQNHAKPQLQQRRRGATVHSQRECDGNLRRGREREREAESHLLARMDPAPTSIGLPFLLLRSFVSSVTECADCLP